MYSNQITIASVVCESMWNIFLFCWFNSNKLAFTYLTVFLISPKNDKEEFYRHDISTFCMVEKNVDHKFYKFIEAYTYFLKLSVMSDDKNFKNWQMCV